MQYFTPALKGRVSSPDRGVPKPSAINVPTGMGEPAVGLLYPREALLPVPFVV